MHLSDLITYLATKPAVSALGFLADDTEENIAHQTLTGLGSDSRQITAGMVFAALQGSQSDGHDHIADALARGAIGVITDDRALDLPDHIARIVSDDTRLTYAHGCSYFWPKRPGFIAAVTGTNGKSSIVEYLRQIWQRASWNSASMGTLGLRRSVPARPLDPKKALLDDTLSLTTPPTERLFQSLNMLADQNITHLAFEASSHGLVQQRLADTPIHLALFTNLSQDHLDYHETMDAYFEAKALLFERDLLPAGQAIIALEDSWGEKLAERLRGQHCVVTTIGRHKDADFRIDKIEAHDFGQTIHLAVQGQSYIYPIALSGDFQAVNALMAAVAAMRSGLSLAESLGALPYLRPVPGRMQRIHGPAGTGRVVVDYAHTPDALKVALQAMRGEVSGKLSVVFGCGGNRDQSKRHLMGEVAAELADELIITDDNPRHEDPAAIRADIIKACPEADEISPRDLAIKTAIDRLGPDDGLLIAGKGHETVQMIGHETLPFDDAAVARNALAASAQSEEARR